MNVSMIFEIKKWVEGQETNESVFIIKPLDFLKIA